MIQKNAAGTRGGVENPTCLTGLWHNQPQNVLTRTAP